MLIHSIQLLRATLRDRAGVSSIEYGVLAIGIIAALTAAMKAFNGDLATAFTTLGTAINTAF
jgi:Flp pilus assembly pilin Flp